MSRHLSYEYRDGEAALYGSTKENRVEEAPKALQQLADMLTVSKNYHTGLYHLLLTSTVSLTPEVLTSIFHVENCDALHTYLQSLGQNERLTMLTYGLSGRQLNEGYGALALLIKEGYFATILTANLDAQLENALLAQGLLPSAFQALVVGRDSYERIMAALEGRANTISIVKLNGHLDDRLVSPTFPDLLELPDRLWTSARYYLNQDLVIVGSLEREYGLARLLNKYKGESIYYALPQVPAGDDDIVKVMISRERNPERYIIAGPGGTFETFFNKLADLLLPRSVTSSPVAEHPIEREDLATTHPIMPMQNLKADVLLVTATEVEADAVLSRFSGASRCFIGDKTYYDLGVISGAKIFMVQSEMGTGGAGGSLLTVRESIQALSPSAIIMVGIAFGFSHGKQRIGDVLVSRQLLGYEVQRVGRSIDGRLLIQPRGDRLSASVRLLDRFNSGSKDWPGQKVHFGLILSGDKLVDDLDFRDQLRQFEQEAIGGEMEGAGLSAAAQRFKIDWILVKAICDWADGKKSIQKKQRQQLAAQNAALFTIHVLKQGGFTA